MRRDQPHIPPDVYGLRSIALMEVLKAAAAIAAGLLLLAHPRASFGHVAEKILHAFHIHRNSDVAIDVISWARRIDVRHVHVFTSCIFGYAVLRLAEGWGLWRARAWAEWLGLLNGVLYLPIEIMELHKGFNWIKFSVLTTNIIVVMYLGWEIRKGRREAREHKMPASPAEALT